MRKLGPSVFSSLPLNSGSCSGCGAAGLGVARIVRWSERSGSMGMLTVGVLPGKESEASGDNFWDYVKHQAYSPREKLRRERA
jgi:hypothetical protein